MGTHSLENLAQELVDSVTTMGAYSVLTSYGFIIFVYIITCKLTSVYLKVVPLEKSTEKYK